MKRKKITKEEYIRLYCTEKRIRDRNVLYVSSETHKKMKLIAYYFRQQYVTTASLVDAILAHHIETHEELFIELDKADHEDFTQWLRSLRKNKSEEEEFEE